MPKVKFKSDFSKIADGLAPFDDMEHIKNDNITIYQFFKLHNNFIDDKKLEGLAPRTISDHIKLFGFFKKYIVDVKKFQIEQVYLNSDIFKNYLYYMCIDKDYKPCTVNIRISSLKCYLNWLFTKKYIQENYGLILRKVKRPEDTIRPLSDTNVKKMLNAPNRNSYAGFRDFTIMVVILDCGIRIQELCNTIIPDVDLRNKTLLVRGEVSKTRRVRVLPLSKQSVVLLKQLIEIATENKCTYVFMSTNSTDKIDHEVIIRSFEKYGKKMGINVRCTPHVFRHTFATNAVKSGMDVFTLQRIMGHNQISTTRQYIQLETNDLIKKHEKMDSVSRYLRGK